MVEQQLTVVVRALDGTALAVARIEDLRLDAKVSLDVFSGRADILFHYLRGVRQVVLESGGFRFGGILSSEIHDDMRCWYFQSNPDILPGGSKRQPPSHES